jgi:hypothetical protein
MKPFPGQPGLSRSKKIYPYEAKITEIASHKNALMSWVREAPAFSGSVRTYYILIYFFNGSNFAF